jgi:hypothetical protein
MFKYRWWISLRRNNGAANEFGIFGKPVDRNFVQLNNRILRDKWRRT